MPKPKKNRKFMVRVFVQVHAGGQYLGCENVWIEVERPDPPSITTMGVSAVMNDPLEVRALPKPKPPAGRRPKRRGRR